MTIWLISYTARGRDLAARVSELLRTLGHSCRTFALPKFCGAGDEPLTCSAGDWAKAGFAGADGLVFVCASGIAVRAVAPHVKDKRRDPAVLVLDEAGRFVIPLLSGHLGGANVESQTTPDGNFPTVASPNPEEPAAMAMALAKAVSAALLSGERVGFCSDLPLAGDLPGELTAGEAELGILVSAEDKRPFARTLRLVPRRYTVGIGCRKGKEEQELEAFLLQNLDRCGVGLHELRALASIDLKKDEPGLVTLAEKVGLPFYTYSAEALRQVPGDFTPSVFVREVTGVDSVCERAAVLSSGGELVVRKAAENGMTFALAKKEEAIRFE